MRKQSVRAKRIKRTEEIRMERVKFADVKNLRQPGTSQFQGIIAGDFYTFCWKQIKIVYLYPKDISQGERVFKDVVGSVWQRTLDFLTSRKLRNFQSHRQGEEVMLHRHIFMRGSCRSLSFGMKEADVPA